jgi:hypothetical protein
MKDQATNFKNYNQISNNTSSGDPEGNGSPVILAYRKGDEVVHLMMASMSFGWDRKNRGLVSQQVWHDNPFLIKAVSAKHMPKF